MQYRQLFFAVLSIAALVLVGCKKDEGTTNPVPTTPPSFSAPQITNFGGPSPTNALTAIRTVTSLTVPIIGTTYTEVNTGVAAFGNPGTDRGDVKIVYSGMDYPFAKTTNAGAVSYAYTPSITNPTGIPLVTSATPVQFVVSGSPGYALGVNTVTVPGQIRLSAPTDSVISKSANLTLTWTFAGAAGARTAVYVTDAAGHFKFYENLGAITSYTVPASDMASFATGFGFVGVVSYNFVLTNSNQAVLIGEAIATKLLTISN